MRTLLLLSRENLGERARERVFVYDFFSICSEFVTIDQEKTVLFSLLEVAMRLEEQTPLSEKTRLEFTGWSGLVKVWLPMKIIDWGQSLFTDREGLIWDEALFVYRVQGQTSWRLMKVIGLSTLLQIGG